jgi:lipoyl(octanoyl) transferase
VIIEDLGLLAYKPAWEYQERIHQRVLEGEEERLLLVEHPPVVTFGRRPGVDRNLIASDEQLQQLGVEVVQSDRGGDITFHGPGQLVAYPIVRLNDHGLSVGAFVHRLEDVVIATLGGLGISAHKDPAAIGIWTQDGNQVAKICAIGVRIRRGVSLHGLALNVATDLRYFNLIVPCGLVGRPVTSLQKILGDEAPPMAAVKEALSTQFISHFQSLASCPQLPSQ